MKEQERYLKVRKLHALCSWLENSLYGVSLTESEKRVVGPPHDPLPCIDWQDIETAPLDGRSVLIEFHLKNNVYQYAIAHYMRGCHCVEDHPSIAPGWYYWTGNCFELAPNPTIWHPLPKLD